MQAVIPPVRDGTGKHLSFTVLLDAPAWNSCLLDGIHGKYIIKRYEKRLHCIGPSCNTEQYLFRYGFLCRDPEYGIEGSGCIGIKDSGPAGRGALPGERFRSLLFPPPVSLQG